MNVKCHPKELAVALLSRSICSVQCAAVIADGLGTYAWGHNHIGFDGLGAHAESEAIRRANRKRLPGATLYIAAQRRRTGRSVNARPCPDCQRLLAKHPGLTVEYRDEANIWRWLD